MPAGKVESIDAWLVELLEKLKISAEGGNAMRVTTQGGFVAFESIEGDYIFYTRQNQPGLWRMPAAGGPEELLTDRLQPVDGNNWFVSPAGIYFVNRPSWDRPEAVLLDVRTRRWTTIAPQRAGPLARRTASG